MAFYFQLLLFILIEGTRASYNIPTDTLCFETGFANLYVSQYTYRCAYVECNITNSSTTPTQGTPITVTYLDELSMTDISTLNQSFGTDCSDTFITTNCTEFELDPYICGCPICKGSASCYPGFNRNSEGICQYTQCDAGTGTATTFPQSQWQSNPNVINLECPNLWPVNCAIQQFIVDNNTCSCPTCVPDECSTHSECETIYGNNSFMCKVTYTGHHTFYSKCKLCQEEFGLIHDTSINNVICGKQSCDSIKGFPVINLANMSYADLVTYCPLIAYCPQNYSISRTDNYCCATCDSSINMTAVPTQNTASPTQSPQTTTSPTHTTPSPIPAPTVKQYDCEEEPVVKRGSVYVTKGCQNGSICISGFSSCDEDGICGGWCEVATICNKSTDCTNIFQNGFCYHGVCWPCTQIEECSNSTAPTKAPTDTTPSPTKGAYNCENDKNCENDYFCQLDTCNFCGGWCMEKSTLSPTIQTSSPTTPQYDCSKDDNCNNGYFCKLNTCNFCGGWCTEKRCIEPTDCVEGVEWCAYDALPNNSTAGLCMDCDCEDGITCNQFGVCGVDTTSTSPAPINSVVQCSNSLQCSQGYEYCNLNGGITVLGVCEQCNCDVGITCNGLGVCNNEQGNMSSRYTIFVSICLMFVIFSWI